MTSSFPKPPRKSSNDLVHPKGLIKGPNGDMRKPRNPNRFNGASDQDDRGYFSRREEKGLSVVEGTADPFKTKPATVARRSYASPNGGVMGVALRTGEQVVVKPDKAIDASVMVYSAHSKPKPQVPPAPAPLTDRQKRTLTRKGREKRQ